jgi:hypothetical protein
MGGSLKEVFHYGSKTQSGQSRAGTSFWTADCSNCGLATKKRTLLQRVLSSVIQCITFILMHLERGGEEKHCGSKRSRTR